MSECPVHGTPMKTVPLDRSDGTQIGNLTLDLCPTCENETEDDFMAFLDRVRDGRFDD